jgi:NADPH:quinone reductase
MALAPFVLADYRIHRGARMKIIRVHAYGGPEVLRVEEAEVPEPGSGQALVRIEAVGVNFMEIYQRTGHYKVAPPFTPGTEAAGTVEAVGPGVSIVKPGDRVGSVSMLGAYAEYALAPAERLVPLPDRVTTRQAAAILLQGMTAHYLTTSTYRLSRGHTCLVHAAAGGVGLLLCQMARRRGARVIGTVSTEEKAALAREAGADEVILYTQTDFETEVKRLTGGAGVNVTYDSVGRTTFTKGLNCIVPRGLMALYGQSSGPVDPIDPQALNQKGSLFLTRPSLTHYIATRAELLERAGEVLGWVSDGSLTVRIHHEFPLEQAAEAQRELEGRRTTGKVLLVP